MKRIPKEGWTMYNFNRNSNNLETLKFDITKIGSASCK